MAIVQPDFVLFESGQDATWTVSLDAVPTGGTSTWTVAVTVCAYNGGTALITKTTGSGITNPDTANGVWIVTFSAADLALLYGPGAYVIQMHRTNAGYTYPITDPSPLVLRPSASTAYPTITNLGEYYYHAMGGAIALDDAMAAQTVQTLNVAEQRVKNYCQRDFVYRASTTEYYDGTGTDTLILRRKPVWSIAAIYEDRDGNGGETAGSFDATTSVLTAGTDYWLPLTSVFGDNVSNSGIVQRIAGSGWWWGGAGVWPYRLVQPQGQLGTARQPLPGCLKVVYTAGYRLMPYDLKQAVWDLATFQRTGALWGQIPQSESGEGYSRSFGPVNAQYGMPQAIIAALEPYRAASCYVG